MAKIKNGFDKLSENDLFGTGGSISKAMAGNPNFPTLDRKTATVSEMTRKYGELLNLADGGGKVAIAEKDAARLKLITALRSLGNGVTDVAEGDYDLLVTTNFPMEKQREPSKPLVSPQPPVLSGSNPGEIKSKGKRQKGSRAVMHMISADPTDAASWVTVISTRIKHTFSNLQPGTRYWVKFGLTGVNNQVVESQPVSYVSQ